jgi:hypothetical protein
VPTQQKLISWLGLGAALLCMSPALAQAKAARPDPLAAEAGCDHYRGVPIGANDETQQFELMVCTTAKGVRAKVQTSSLVSGWSVRQAVGNWDADGRVLSLRETEFIESKPEPDWRFCLIDSLVLEKTEVGLTGTYVSEACDDRAKLDLVKLEQPGPAGPSGESGGARPASPAPPAPPPAPPPTPEPEPESRARGCACELAATSQPPFALLLLALFGLTRAGKRRRA